MNKSGRVFQINASNGGVPKLPIRQSDVNELGLLSDEQKHKKFHGGPERALCLYSVERIQALQDEGHPIYPGSIGENITIAGLDWGRMVPGVQLKLGESLTVEITSYAVPCKQIKDSFANDQFVRVSQKVNPGWARAYTKVIQTGSIQVGDAVEIVGTV